MSWFPIQFTSPLSNKLWKGRGRERYWIHPCSHAGQSQSRVCGSDKTQMELAGSWNTLCENLKPLTHCWAQKGRVRKSAWHGGEGRGSRMEKLEMRVPVLAAFGDAACPSNGGRPAQVNTPCSDLWQSRVGQGERKTQEIGVGGCQLRPKAWEAGWRMS